MLLQVLSTICAASVYVSQLTPFCAGGLYAEGKEYCNAECIDPCANIPQAACLISPVPFYCQARCIPTTPPLADSVMSRCMHQACINFLSAIVHPYATRVSLSLLLSFSPFMIVDFTVVGLPVQVSLVFHIHRPSPLLACMWMPCLISLETLEHIGSKEQRRIVSHQALHF